MLRVSISEQGQSALPELDVADPRFVIGSAADARVRIPAASARPEHVVIEGGRWLARGEVAVDGTPRSAGASGDVGAGIELVLEPYRIRIAQAPAGTDASPPQRTESLARELMRGLLGGDSAPSLEVERGPVVGVKRPLPPPVSTLVIGRGEEAQWIILDEDLSRAHVEIRRGWDGVSIRDLGSKNGTRVDGARVGPAGVPLHDGARIELGKVELVFRDPAERHLRGEAPPAEAMRLAPAPAAPRPAAARREPWILAGALALAAAAVAGLIWILAS